MTIDFLFCFTQITIIVCSAYTCFHITTPYLEWHIKRFRILLDAWADPEWGQEGEEGQEGRGSEHPGKSCRWSRWCSVWPTMKYVDA